MSRPALPATNTVYFFEENETKEINEDTRCDLAEYCVHFLTKPSSRRQGQIRVLFVLQDDVFFLWWSQFSFNNVWFSCVSKDAMAVIFKDNVIQLMTLSTF